MFTIRVEHVFLNSHSDELHNQILKQLSLILKSNSQIMAKIDDINQLISDINDNTNNIAADLERIAGGLTGGLTATEADDVIAQLQSAADKLKAVADTNPETEEPPVEG